MQNAIPVGPVGGLAEPAAAAKRGTIATRVGHVRRAPTRTHGKVFFTMSPLNYVCSATAVQAPSESLVWTAGHCVYEPGTLGGSFATNWEFVPAYQNRKAPADDSPFGEWPAQKLQATTQWKNSGGVCVPGASLCGDLRFDLGAASVATMAGDKLEDTVGARGIVFNGPRDRTYRAFGYPAEDPFNGKRMYRCKSPYGGADSGDEPKPMRITCDMTGGSSGGGWVTGGKVASVVSYGYEGDSTHLYGPYQGTAAQNLYDSLDNG